MSAHQATEGIADRDIEHRAGLLRTAQRAPLAQAQTQAQAFLLAEVELGPGFALQHKQKGEKAGKIAVGQSDEIQNVSIMKRIIVLRLKSILLMKRLWG